MAQRFKKKPVVIQAMQLRWDTWGEICDFVPKPWFKKGVYLDDKGEVTTDTNGRIGLMLNTLESNQVTGALIAQQDDWIIKGVQGEFYPCKPDIFAATYEAVTE
jgi:hypothetical protein